MALVKIKAVQPPVPPDSSVFPRICQDLLVTVFENGSLVKDYSLEEIRKNAQLTDEEAFPTTHNSEPLLPPPPHSRINNGVH